VVVEPVHQKRVLAQAWPQVLQMRAQVAVPMWQVLQKQGQVWLVPQN
jgi:hypothetical protein